MRGATTWSPCTGRATSRGRSLLLQGHVDVVPEGAADLWTTPPFEPAVRGGRMYGRGAGDMKAGLAAMLMAFAALRRAGLQPAAELYFAAVIEEECTGNGALAVREALPHPAACLIPEPGPGFPALYTAEVGVVWAWVTVTGRPAHVREMQAGVNAIEAAYAVMQRFRDYEAEMNRAERRHPAFAASNHPINVNIGTLEGGEWNSSVATRARLGVRVGVMPGYSCHAVRQDIERLVAAAAADPALRGAKLSVGFQGFMADGCVFPADQAISRTVSALHQRVTRRGAAHLQRHRADRCAALRARRHRGDLLRAGRRQHPRHRRERRPRLRAPGDRGAGADGRRMVRGGAGRRRGGLARPLLAADPLVPQAERGHHAVRRQRQLDRVVADQRGVFRPAELARSPPGCCEGAMLSGTSRTAGPGYR